MGFRMCVFQRTIWRVAVNVSVWIVGITLGLLGLASLAYLGSWIFSLIPDIGLGLLIGWTVIIVLLLLVGALFISWAHRHYLIAREECKTGVPVSILDSQWSG